MVSSVGSNYNQSFGYQQQYQQQYPQQYSARKKDSKMEAYAKTAVRGFVMGSIIDAAVQLVLPRAQKLFTSAKNRPNVHIPKFSLAKMASWGAAFAVIDVGLRAMSSRRD